VTDIGSLAVITGGIVFNGGPDNNNIGADDRLTITTTGDQVRLNGPVTLRSDVTIDTGATLAGDILFTDETTIDSRLQQAARDALRRAVIEYDERHGYRGPLARVSLEFDDLPDVPAEARWQALLADYAEVTGFKTGLVIGIDALAAQTPEGEAVGDGAGEAEAASAEAVARVYFADLGVVSVGFDAVSWAARYIDDNRIDVAPTTVGDVLAPGDIVRFRHTDDGEVCGQ